MRFKVRRTSQHYDETAPCPEAVKGTIESWDHRTCKSPEEFNERKLGDWFGEGTTDHGFVYGPRGGVLGIKRRRYPDHTAWFVEFDSLEALMAFSEKYGDLVLTTALDDRETPEIEIYDDYRE
jgi:hypothetical protein